MRFPGGGELPDNCWEANRRAVKLQWISVAYWISVIILLYFTLGQSQAMKAAWIEDILGLFPPIAFLVASRFRHREPTEAFPWGYHRAISIAYLVAAVALFVLGLFIFIDSAERLIKGDHPPIGLVEIFNVQIWLGWLMLAALLYGVIPPLILGRLKRPLADELHDKVLYTDAKMNQADWLTAAAAMLGVVGIGLGLWWADAVAAIVISLDILHDGQRYLRGSVGDLMDQAPETHDEERPDPLIDRVRREIAATPWVSEAAVRLREQGHLVSGTVWVVPRDGTDLLQRVEALTEALRNLDWRVHDIAVSPVQAIEDAPEALVVRD
jgi:cation diffusion facilitator family transporter